MTHRRMIGGGTLLALLLASAGAAAQGDAAARGAQIQAVTEASAREVAGLIAQPGFAEAVRTTLAASPERGRLAGQQRSAAAPGQGLASAGRGAAAAARLCAGGPVAG
ncbi:hypothetical protein G6F62_013591 [Rhizopus arrhizus]|nr:hypothetical protein G6F62_013591 [Rhizopus arrhizus]